MYVSFCLRMSFPGLRSRQIRHDNQRQMLHIIVPFPITDTWTHDFACIQPTMQKTTLSNKQAEKLSKAGLGRTKIKFKYKNASHAEVCEKLEETFPQLSSVGGFTLQRAKTGGQNRPLFILNSKWYTVQNLKKEIPGSACIYIRPLQRNLNLSIPQKASEILNKLS